MDLRKITHPPSPAPGLDDRHPSTGEGEAPSVACRRCNTLAPLDGGASARMHGTCSVCARGQLRSPPESHQVLPHLQLKRKRSYDEYDTDPVHSRRSSFSTSAMRHSSTPEHSGLGSGNHLPYERSDGEDELFSDDGTSTSQVFERSPANDTLASLHRVFPQSSSDIASVQPIRSAKRRKKRSEEERKEHFQKDPYVEEFEAYRVLCKLCSKWIRLRPNSTYCSIPWEAHRSSCLKRNSKRAAAVSVSPRDHHSVGTSPQVSPSVRYTPLDVPPPSAYATSSLGPLNLPLEKPLSPPSARIAGAISNRHTFADGRLDRASGSPTSDADRDSASQRSLASNHNGNHRSPSARLQDIACLCSRPAELDSAEGRRDFIVRSIAYLRRTTYAARSHELTIERTSAFIHAALPPSCNQSFEVDVIANALRA